MSKQNENRSGYKETKVGWIPDEWKCVRLSSIARIQTGVSKSSKKKFIRPKDFPYLRVANVQDGYLSLDEIKSLTIDECDFKRYALRQNDVLFTEGGDFDKLGRGTLWRGEIPNCIHQNHIFSVRVDTHLLRPFFLSAMASGSIGKRYFLFCAKQSTNLASINSSQLKAFPIPLPPLPEQKKIAKILSAWDRAIDQVGKIIDAKQRLKKGLMQQLLSGRMRFSEFGNPVQKKDELSEGWREARLGDVGIVKMGTSPSSTSYNADGCGIPLIQGNADIENRKTSPSRWTTEITTECFVGDLVMTVRAPVGEIAMSVHHACVGRGACVIKPKAETDKNFLFQLLISREQKWNRFGQGSTFTCLIGEDIRNYKFVIPNSKEQRRIAAVLSTCDQEIELLRKKETTLRQQKKGLMQKLLTGEIRVKVVN